MLFFVDESHQTISGKRVGSLGAVAIPASRYNGFCGAVYRAKRDGFGATELHHYEIRGTIALGKGAFARQERQGDAPSFPVLETVIERLHHHGGAVFAVPTKQPDLLTLRTADMTWLTDPYVQFLNRIERFMRTRFPSRRGILFFDQLGHTEDRRAACTIQNFIARTSADRFRRRFIQVPHFTHSVVSPGLQAADLVAYLAAQSLFPRERPELGPWWKAITAMAPTRGAIKPLEE